MNALATRNRSLVVFENTRVNIRRRIVDARFSFDPDLSRSVVRTTVTMRSEYRRGSVRSMKTTGIVRERRDPVVSRCLHLVPSGVVPTEWNFTNGGIFSASIRGELSASTRMSIPFDLDSKAKNKSRARWKLKRQVPKSLESRKKEKGRVKNKLK